ncbi:cyclic nucleotide-binding domain-containing protein [Oharaeibacter diazotrophicus]|uniref:Cyclic nucleotide-binding protein n=1 Tax=Oharaeibacter diazotrophicus TaxID=1920512 RepID=A0A4V3CVZ7_9HYPH|nr:cyclic nucleotide-binding domain-containing protein [Oharaeibacter diazotrophicus]TDP84398.1 cyclic nucleotide-binding protein [Oharaeibacter diazotrophicus]BBE73436.1 cAMP receptor protein [Pleomorphomonas sp. SM30]GLS75227.1 cyclic nucleotide-binding protein [Oharaeibacter diazotrophicus]
MSLESDVRLLQRVPMLSEFTEDKLRLLAFSAENRSYRSGQRLFSAGDRADSGFVVVSGEVAIHPAGRDDVVIETVGEAGLIGELSMIVEGERATTAVAVGDVAVIQIRRPLFRRMLDEYPEVAERLRGRVAERLVRTTGELGAVKRRLDAIEGG